MSYEIKEVDNNKLIEVCNTNTNHLKKKLSKYDNEVLDELLEVERELTLREGQ